MLIPRLPDRAPAVVAGLPASFTPAEIDSLPGSVCWYDGAWLVSTDAWADRRLGRLESGAWSPFPAPAGWARQPITGPDGSLAVLVHERNDDHGRLFRRTPGEPWGLVADPVEVGAVTDWDGRHLARRAEALPGTGVNRRGHVRLPSGTVAVPPGCTVTHLVSSPDRRLLLIVVRRGGTYRAHVHDRRTGKQCSPAPFRGVVHGRPLWLGDDRIVLTVQRWPSLVPVIWSWRRDRTEFPWPESLVGTARSVAAGPGGDCVTALSTPTTPRRLTALDRPVPSTAQTPVVHNGEQLVPCVVFEPAGRPRGTVVYFPGGPHEPIWAEYSHLSRALADAGWRVVRVNTRSSGLREHRFRPRSPVRYGVDDVADSLAVIDALGTGPVVTMGVSYGGYLAAMAGERSPRCRGIVSLSGFFGRRDLDATTHPDVRRFLGDVFPGPPPGEPRRLTRPVFAVHGTADTRIPIDAVRARAGAGFTLLEMPGQGHAVISDHDARTAYPPLLDWLDHTI